MTRNPEGMGLRRFYQKAALEYDSFLEENLTLHETQSFLSLLRRNYRGSFLDVASGTGRISNELVRTGSYYVGLDLSDLMLAQLRRKVPSAHIDLLCASATDLPIRNSSLQLATCFGVTGYFDARAQLNLMRELSRVLLKGGDLAIDFLRPRSRTAQVLKKEEMDDGNRVYLQSLGRVRRRIETAAFTVVTFKKTPRQIQFLLRKDSGKD